jgi:hypothetical protein
MRLASRDASNFGMNPVLVKGVGGICYAPKIILRSYRIWDMRWSPGGYSVTLDDHWMIIIEHITKMSGEMTKSQNASLPSNLTRAATNTQITEVYVRQMANELAELARSAGCRRLSALLTLASIEAETSPLAVQMTSDPSPRSKKAI